MKLLRRNRVQPSHEENEDRLLDIIDLLDEAPINDVDTVLDVGAGRGELAKYFANRGKKVMCTGINIHSYTKELDALRTRYGIEYVECDIENMPFPDKAFDAVVMSHVLEHCPNVSAALKNARRVLREGGLLMIFVPPQESIVCAGHIAVGWNVGQLIYVLLLNGFDVRKGNFIQYGYNVCGFVRRTETMLPNLRGDRGDIATLSKAGFFPSPIASNGENHDYFYGCVRCVNWPSPKKYLVGARSSRVPGIVLLLMDRLPFRGLKLKLGEILTKVGYLLMRSSIANPDRLE